LFDCLRLKRVMSSLLAETNWPDDLRAQCINSIKAHHNSPQSTPFNVSHMVADMGEVGRASFPPQVRAKMHSLLYRFAQSFINVDESLAPHPDDVGIDDGEGHRASSSKEHAFPLLYQSKDAIPDPGLGLNVPNIETDLVGRRGSRSPTPPEEDEEDEEEEEELRLPPPLLPVLRPESELVVSSVVKDDIRSVERNEDERMSKDEPEEEEAEASGGDADEDEDDDEDEDPVHEEDEEEELMDV